jgi:ABC-2 type transport system ATP-binding protein
MNSIIEIDHVCKTYDDGFQALKNIDIKINSGEIFALLGPNGAGKTTLISIICGVANKTSGSILVDGHDILKDYRHTRSMIGLVPQELTMDMFETVFNTVSFSRGLFNKPKNPKYVEKVLKDLTLWDKRNNQLRELSGGMKRRVMIAKALAHEPKILFLDEPTAGVDVELRKAMWQLVHELRESGVTIILTTHYIEEAEEMADRVGVINNGEIILVENKNTLMKKLGKKELILDLHSPLAEIPKKFSNYNLTLDDQHQRLTYTYDSNLEDNGIPELLNQLCEDQIHYKDLNTRQSSLEDIFVGLVHK